MKAGIDCCRNKYIKWKMLTLAKLCTLTWNNYGHINCQADPFFKNKRTLSKSKTNGLIKGLLIHTKQISGYFLLDNMTEDNLARKAGVSLGKRVAWLITVN